MELIKIPLQKDDSGNLLPFETPKHKYTPIRIGTPMGLQRWSVYRNMESVVGFGKTFASIADALELIEKDMVSAKPPEDRIHRAILGINSLRRGIVEASKERFDQAFYMATIFIAEDSDPNPLQWSMEKAQKIVEDWAESGVDETEMLFFCLSTVSGFTRHYQKVKAEIQAAEEVSSDVIGSTKMEKLGD